MLISSVAVRGPRLPGGCSLAVDSLPCPHAPQDAPASRRAAGPRHSGGAIARARREIRSGGRPDGFKISTNQRAHLRRRVASRLVVLSRSFCLCPAGLEPAHSNRLAPAEVGLGSPHRRPALGRRGCLPTGRSGAQRAPQPRRRLPWRLGSRGSLRQDTSFTPPPTPTLRPGLRPTLASLRKTTPMGKATDSAWDDEQEKQGSTNHN